MILFNCTIGIATVQTAVFTTAELYAALEHPDLDAQNRSSHLPSIEPTVENALSLPPEITEGYHALALVSYAFSFPMLSVGTFSVSSVELFE